MQFAEQPLALALADEVQHAVRHHHVDAGVGNQRLLLPQAALLRLDGATSRLTDSDDAVRTM